MKSKLLSLLVHVGAVLAMLHLSGVADISRNLPKNPIHIADTKVFYHLPPKTEDAAAGGGGRDLLPPSQGELPRTAVRAFVPPTAYRPDHQPLLPIEPAIQGFTTEMRQPAVVGLPGGVPGPPSSGPGGPAGIGSGSKRGIGPGSRDGLSGRGLLGYTEPPAILYQVDPEYSEEARKARLTGTVVLYVEITELGLVGHVEVRQSLGLGLDEKAIEAIRKWRFRPARKDGKPVASPALVDVHFQLL